jgi:hypothetical protein
MAAAKIVNMEMPPVSAMPCQADILAVSEVFRFPVRNRLWWQEQKLLMRVKIPPAYFDSEEYRFLDRCYHYSGARGIAANAKFVFIALQNSVLVYGLDLQKLVRRIEHPLFNGIHEIVWQHGRLYVTCAVTDSLVVVDETGNELQRFCLGENQFLLDVFRLPRRGLDNCLDYRIMHRARRLFHVNAVQVRGGDIYVHLNRQGSFVKIHPHEQIIIRDPDLCESHNAQFSADGEHILINDTGHYSLRVYSAEGSLVRRIDLRELPLPVDFAHEKTFGPSRHAIKTGWLRGLAFSVVNREIAYLGLSPTLVVAINFLTGAYEGHFRLRQDFHASVHWIFNLSQSLREAGDR